jgi:hypothetical protein
MILLTLLSIIVLAVIAVIPKKGGIWNERIQKVTCYLD